MESEKIRKPEDSRPMYVPESINYVRKLPVAHLFISTSRWAPIDMNEVCVEGSAELLSKKYHFFEKTRMDLKHKFQDFSNLSLIPPQPLSINRLALSVQSLSALDSAWQNRNAEKILMSSHEGNECWWSKFPIHCICSSKSISRDKFQVKILSEI